MKLVLAIYTKKNYKAVHLPAIDNSDYELMLYKTELGLRKNLKIRLEVMDGIWSIKGSTDYKVKCMNSSYEGKPLEKGIILKVQSLEKGETISILVCEKEDTKPYKKYLMCADKILIGGSKEADIQYQSKGITSSKHAEIIWRNGVFTIKDLSTNGVYCNHKKIVMEQNIFFGDVIDIYGLSIVCLGKYLAVNSLEDPYFINEKTLQEVMEADLAERTFIEKKYNNEEKLVRISLRNLPKLYSGEEKIDPAPQKKEIENKPAWMSVLPSFTMVLPMLLGYSLMNSGSMSMGLVISGGSAVVGVTWAIINLRYARRKYRDEEIKRLKKYESYLVQCADRIREKFEFNKQALKDMYPDARTCSKYTEDSPEIWARKSNYTDFLFVRLGIGSQPFQVKVNVPTRGFNMIDDEVAELPEKIVRNYEKMDDVPVGVSITEHNVIGIVTGKERQKATDLCQVMITQIAANQSYIETRIAMLCKKDVDSSKEPGYIKWFPHIWNEEKTMRFYANNENDASEVLMALSDVLRIRTERISESTKQQRFLPHYILFVEDPAYLEKQPITKYLFNRGKELGVTTVMMSDTYEHLPNICDFVIQNNDEFEGTYAVKEGGDIRKRVVFDEISAVEVEKMARRMSAMRVSQVENNTEIPSSLTFFEMHGIHRVEELNALDKWKKNRTYESMQALVGQKIGRQNCYLDIREGKHGPHGLVAGTTGSGKSETLQTYILSLAANFSPQDVGLFIIDFKGGGMGNLFTDLPHTLGVVSNLSGNQVRRAMVSITSEIKRRQRIFNDWGVNKIDAYTKLFKNKEATIPLPHLLIIIDEFAELKREQPEFMKQLISVAQVGRSLGIHLILSTQKPGGTVDENIWSNTRFKLCLRVADRQDSNEMLKRPDAAFLTQAGRCYLQVGENEVFDLFQSGWSGATYDEGSAKNEISVILLNQLGQETSFQRKLKSQKKRLSTIQWMQEVLSCVAYVIDNKHLTISELNMEELGMVAKAVVEHINLKEERYNVNPTNLKKIESVISSCPDEMWNVEELAVKIVDEFQMRGKNLPEKQERTQLDAVVKYLANIAKNSGMENKQLLWMPVLPTNVCLEQLSEFKKAAYRNGEWCNHSEYKLSISMGIIDDPENQMQYPLIIDFLEKGHLLLTGNVTSGKSTFMQTLIYGFVSTYSPDEVNIYVVDYSNQMLCAFEGDAHVGGVIIEGEDDKLSKLFGLIKKILYVRKQQIRGGSFKQHIKVHGTAMPAIVLIIDGYANFREKTDNQYEAILKELAGNAEGYGIYLAISSGGVGSAEVQSKIADNMRQKICLEMTDKYSYGQILAVGITDVLPETGVKGRGLVNIDGNVLEYQTALACHADGDYERSEKIKSNCKMMSRSWKGRRAENIPEIPEKPTWGIFSNLSQYKNHINEKKILPVAYYQKDASLYGIDLIHYCRYLILGKEHKGKSVFLRNVACAAKDMGGKIYFIDKGNKADQRTATIVNAEYITTYEEMKNMVITMISLTNERGARRKYLEEQGFDDEEIYNFMSEEFEPVFYLIADFAEFLKLIYTEIEGMPMLNARIEHIFAKTRLLNVFFVAAANVSQTSQMSAYPAYAHFVADKMGVLLGGEVNRQHIFKYQNLRYAEQEKQLKVGLAHAVCVEDNSNLDLIVFPNNKGRIEE